MFIEQDYKNIIAVINFAFQNGMVKSQDDAKALLSLQAKCESEITPVEEENGNNVPASD